MDADVLIFDCLDELDVVGPLEVLRRAGVAARLVSHGAERAATGRWGLAFTAEGVLGDRDVAILLVPGGGWGDRSPAGARAESEAGELPRAIAAAAARARIVAGVCTGTMLLAHAGLLSGRRASTHASALADLTELGVDAVPDRVVDEGDVVTCAGVTSGIDLALHLVERELGAERAASVAKAIEWTRTPASM